MRIDNNNQRSRQTDQDGLAERIQTTLIHSMRRNLWTRILRRTGLSVVGFVIAGTALLETVTHFFPQVNEMPYLVFLTVTLPLFPIVILSVRYGLALLVALQMAHLDLLGVLGNAVAKKDSNTSEHNFRVAIMAVRLAEAAKADPQLIAGLSMGAFLHDVGKIGVPDAILLKPGTFSRHERLEMENHVIYGSEIVADSPWLQGAARVVRFHHEKFDGSGYPDGKRSRDIPIEARIFSIVDVFDALTSSRPYKAAMPFEQAMVILDEGRGTHFDPDFLDAFMPIAKNLYNQVIQTDFEHQKEMAVAIIEKYYGQWPTGVVRCQKRKRIGCRDHKAYKCGAQDCEGDRLRVPNQPGMIRM